MAQNQADGIALPPGQACGCPPPALSGLASVGRFEEFENFAAFLGGEVGPHAHVEHGDVPLGIVIGTGRTDVVAASAILGPHLRAAPGRGDG